MYLSPTGVRTICPPAASTARLESAVRQHRHHESAARQGAAGEAVEGEDPEDLIAVDDLPGRIDRDQPIGIAVEGEADVGPGPHDRLGQGCRVRRPATDVDVDPVRIRMDDLDVGARCRQDLRAER